MSADRKDSENRGVFGRIMTVAIFALIGAACGIIVLHETDAGPMDGRQMLFFAGMLLVMYAAIIVQTAIHEAGHLVFGLLSGYRFGSYRILSFMWLKEGGRLRFRRLDLAGTAGQCLMDPPDMEDGKIPVFLYNMGGAFMNVITAAVFFALSLLCGGHTFLSVTLKLLAVIGIAFALLNGLPMRVGPVDNDGRNALSLSRDPQALRAFWIQMKALNETARGVRLKDMPEAWFRVPGDEEMENGIVATVGVLAAGRLMDEHRFTEADALMERLRTVKGVSGLHRGMMLNDRVYVELVTKNRPEALAKLLTKEFRNTAKMMKTSPSVMRTEYALALLSEDDAKKAEKALKRFTRQAGVYPYPCEIEGERELIRIAAEKGGPGDDPAV